VDGFAEGGGNERTVGTLRCGRVPTGDGMEQSAVLEERRRGLSLIGGVDAENRECSTDETMPIN
jgi:hypothetical protein